MLMIRFQRIGRTNDPAFRIVVLEKARAAKSGRITEQVGSYNPRSKALTLDEAKVKSWIAKGAQPTGSVQNLLIEKGILTGKKVNVVSVKKSAEKAEEAPATASPKVEAAPSEETPPVTEEKAEEPKTEEVVATPAA